MNMISEAICFATERFDGKYRKNENYPAIFHSLEAAQIVQSFCDDEEVVCAAVLHDTVEDTNVDLNEIKEKFGERVAYLVASETEQKYPDKNAMDTWLMRKNKTLEVLKNTDDLGIKAVWLGDKLSNMRSFYRIHEKMGVEMWNLFHQKDPNEHKRYYQTIAIELKELDYTRAYAEYIFLMNKVFGD